MHVGDEMPASRIVFSRQEVDERRDARQQLRELARRLLGRDAMPEPADTRQC